MCLIVATPRNCLLTRADLKRGFEANGDGAGFGYANRGNLIVQKGFFNFNEFWRAFNRIQKGNPTVVHFRKASLGIKSKANCHPFFVNEDLIVAHNGTMIQYMGDVNTRKSDTLIFVQQILKPLFKKVPDAHLDPTISILLEETISVNNKMVFLDSRGRCKILRAWVGEWYEGSWWSNDSFKKSLGDELEEEFEKEMRERAKNQDWDLLSEDEWKTRKAQESQDPKERREKFRKRLRAKTTPTEQILGGPSRLGEVDKVGFSVASGQDQKQAQQKTAQNNYLVAIQKGFGRREIFGLTEAGMDGSRMMG